MARIIYSYVGELAEFNEANTVNTPDGMRWCRPILIDALQRRGHQIIAVQQRVEDKPYHDVEYSDGLPDADLLFCEWRWKTYRGDTPDLNRQTELLTTYHGQIPVILYDAAYQITDVDEKAWPIAVIADPGIDPKYITRRRERLFFWTDGRTYLPVRDPLDLVNYSYIGNDYDRPIAFNTYIVAPADKLRQHGVQTAVYGNWVERSSTRSPRRRVQCSNNVMFGGRLSYRDSMIQLNNSIATTHLCKPEYDARGNVTVRFTESFAVNTPALVPGSFLNNEILGKNWTVNNPDDVIRKVKFLLDMTVESRASVVQEQQHNLFARYDVSVNAAVQFIESYLK